MSLSTGQTEYYLPLGADPRIKWTELESFEEDGGWMRCPQECAKAWMLVESTEEVVQDDIHGSGVNLSADPYAAYDMEPGWYYDTEYYCDTCMSYGCEDHSYYWYDPANVYYDQFVAEGSKAIENADAKSSSLNDSDGKIEAKSNKASALSLEIPSPSQTNPPEMKWGDDAMAEYVAGQPKQENESEDKDGVGNKGVGQKEGAGAKNDTKAVMTKTVSTWYYFNTLTGQSMWETPPGLADIVATNGGWQLCSSDDGSVYWWHEESGESAWADEPSEG